jgi:hypothetical protein
MSPLANPGNRIVQPSLHQPLTHEITKECGQRSPRLLSAGERQPGSAFQNEFRYVLRTNPLPIRRLISEHGFQQRAGVAQIVDPDRFDDPSIMFQVAVEGRQDSVGGVRRQWCRRRRRGNNAACPQQNKQPRQTAGIMRTPTSRPSGTGCAVHFADVAVQGRMGDLGQPNACLD